MAGWLNTNNIVIVISAVSGVIVCTEKQARNPAEVHPGDVRRRADVLHPRKIEDDRHAADEHKVGASDDA